MYSETIRWTIVNAYARSTAQDWKGEVETLEQAAPQTRPPPRPPRAG